MKGVSRLPGSVSGTRALRGSVLQIRAPVAAGAGFASLQALLGVLARRRSTRSDQALVYSDTPTREGSMKGVSPLERARKPNYPAAGRSTPVPKGKIFAD